MSDLVVEFLNTVNIIQLIAIGVMIWFFYSRLDTKIEKLDSKIEKTEENLKTELNKLGDKVEDVDRRLCRIEGSLSTHGHCLFNQAQPEKKGMVQI